jgi:ferritin-like protein
MSTVYHETGLSEDAKDIHRALASLIEELEAVDWYNQRADVTGNPELKSILLHNRNEEIEHAAMALEWLRRKIPEFDEELRTYLFSTAPITEIEGEDVETEEEGKHPAGSLGIGKTGKGGLS